MYDLLVMLLQTYVKLVEFKREKSIASSYKLLKINILVSFCNIVTVGL